MISVNKTELPRTQSLEWYERAAKVIPGGTYGHTSPAATLPYYFPYYVDRAEGCYLWDVDGNRYLDFMCAYGPVILGHQHPGVEAAADAQRKKGGLYSHPSTVMVELAELLVGRIDFADWCVFGKNGSDMTTWSLQVARQATGKKKVLVIKGAYHGVDAWTNPSPGGIIEEDRTHVHTFKWNDIESLRETASAHKGEVAAIMVTPFHHPAFGANQIPETAFVEAVNDLCEKESIVLIMDDIRAGFRISDNGSHGLFGWKPDLSCYCKAIGNGYPVSVTVGKEHLKDAGGKVFLTGSYWNDGIALAACKKCLEIIKDQSVPEKLTNVGQSLLDGLAKAAKANDVKIRCHGPTATPIISFDNDPDLRKMQRFSEFCAINGVLFHPHHNWFMSLAHNEEAIREAVEVAEKAFCAMKEEEI